MATHYVYTQTDQESSEVLSSMIQRLEQRGADPNYTAIVGAVLDMVDWHETNAVIEMGCGTGLVSRRIANRSGFSGRVYGFDLSPHLVEAAASLALQCECNRRIHFQVGDCEALPRPGGEADLVVLATVISQSRSPDALLAEARRLLRPSGRILVFDGDYASLRFGHEDSGYAEAMSQLLVEGHFANPYILRTFTERARRLGLDILRTDSFVLAEFGRARFWDSFLQALRRMLPVSGVRDLEHALRFIDEQCERSRSGSFFGSCNYHAILMGFE